MFKLQYQSITSLKQHS